jgi:dipeptide/tripeptide permease
MRLQVLRIFHLIYVLGLVLTGGFLGARLWGARPRVAGAILALAGAGMFLGARGSYPASAHIEPGLAFRQTPV